jgi:hypothetical protein
MWFKVVILMYIIAKCLQHVVQILRPDMPRWSKGVRIVIFLELGAVGASAFFTSYPPVSDGLFKSTILSLVLVAVTEVQLDGLLNEDFLRELPKILVERKKRRGK